MSDLVEFLVELFIEGIIEVAQSSKSPKIVRFIIYFILFSIVSAFLWLSFIMREDIVLFLTFSLTGSILGLWLLHLLKNHAKETNEK